MTADTKTVYGYEAKIDGEWRKVTGHELLFRWIGDDRLTAYRQIHNRAVVEQREVKP